MEPAPVVRSRRRQTRKNAFDPDPVQAEVETGQGLPATGIERSEPGMA